MLLSGASQGTSFIRGQPWLLHLNIPPDKFGIDGKGVLVTITRFIIYGDLYLLAPLHDGSPESRARVIQAFAAALARQPEEEAEMLRVDALEADTIARHWQRLHDAYGIHPLTPREPLQRLVMPPVADIRAATAAYEMELRPWVLSVPPP